LQRPLASTSLLALDDTDLLRERFSSRLRLAESESQAVYLPVWEYHIVVDALTSVAGRYSSTEAFLLQPLDRYTGAVRVPVGTLLGHLEEVWKVVGENWSSPVRWCTTGDPSSL
jgi:hypothetical protein